MTTADKPEERDTEVFPKEFGPQARDLGFPDLPGAGMGAMALYTPSHLVSMQFIKAQGNFIRSMTFFLEEGRNVSDDKEYISHLTGYAKAQNDMIAAQQEFMRQIGVL